MDWLRWHHGTSTDPKWRVIAAESAQPLTAVLAVWGLMLETASQTEDRGTLAGWRDRVAAAALDLEPAAVEAVRAAMQGLVLDGERVVEWKKYREPLLRDRPPAREWEVLRRTVFARDDYTCVYCGARGGRLECDHVYPVSRGGSHKPSNLAAACFGCNRSKRDKTLAEWRGGID